MPMFSLHVLDTLQILKTQNTSLLLRLGGHTVRQSLYLLCFLSSNIREISTSSALYLWVAAVVAYFPKSKADKRRHLLGTSEGSGEGEKESEVSTLSASSVLFLETSWSLFFFSFEFLILMIAIWAFISYDLLAPRESYYFYNANQG